MTIDAALRDTPPRSGKRLGTILLLANTIGLGGLVYSLSSARSPLASYHTDAGLRTILLGCATTRVVSQSIYGLFLTTYAISPTFAIMIAAVETVLDSIAIAGAVWNRQGIGLDGFDAAMGGAFALGILLERLPELHRAVWKSKPENIGKPHMSGMHAVLVHPNYAGYLVWRSALFGFSKIPVLQFFILILVYDFVAGDIAAQKKRNVEKYGEPFKRYWDNTWKLIPFVY